MELRLSDLATLGVPRLRYFLQLIVLVLLALTRRSASFAVVGYVPEYRFKSLDWDGTMQRTTHLILFSAEPTADGDLNGLDRFWLLRQGSSPFRLALKRAGSRAPKVLISIGGQSRSDHFAAAAADKTARRKLARRIVQLLLDFPVLSGIDLNWETPQNVDQWRDLRRLAHEIRDRMSGSDGVPLPGNPLLTMSYHPVTGAVDQFASLQSKGKAKSFVEYFDMCHAMSYSLFDENHRHATQRAAKMSIEEWAKKGLPSSRLTLGIPFFGISRHKNGVAASWSELLERDPTLKDRPDVDETEDGIYFNNAQTLSKKVRFAMRRHLAGVMIWELGHDKAPSDANTGSLLRHVWDAAIAAAAELGSPSGSPNHMKPEGSFWTDLFALLPMSEDNIICGIAGIVGAYMLMKSIWYNTPVRDRANAFRGDNDPPSEDLEEHLKIVRECEEKYEKLMREEREAREAAKQAKAAAEATAGDEAEPDETSS